MFIALTRRDADGQTHRIYVQPAQVVAIAERSEGATLTLPGDWNIKVVEEADTIAAQLTAAGTVAALDGICEMLDRLYDTLRATGDYQRGYTFR